MTADKWSDDQYLLNAILRRENAAFRHLYRNHLSSLHKFITLHGGSSDTADDIQQEVIIHIYEKVTSGKFVLSPGTKLSTYLFTVGKYMFYKSLRNPVMPEDFIPEPLFEDEDEYMDIGISDEAVANALDILDPDCKKILYRVYYDNRSMREIADEMQTITEDNLRKRKYKCMQKFRKVLIFKNEHHG